MQLNPLIVFPAEFADRLAVVTPSLQLTYRELDNHIVARSRELVDPIHCFPAQKDLGSIIELLACLRAGIVACPLNPAFPEAMQKELHEQVRDCDRGATIIFTSGSTGRPKAAVHSMENHYYSALGANENMPLTEGDSWLLSLPLYHVGGLAIVFRCLVAGAIIAIPDTNASLSENVDMLGVTHLSCVATQLKRLLASGGAAGLKAVLAGGGPVPDELVTEAAAIGLPVHGTYGCTEMSSQVFTDHLLPHRELMIADDGEILMKGPVLFEGYYTPAGIDTARDGDGWYRSGDIGEWRNGHLEILGRKDSMFISGGENIHPEAIEGALLELHGVDQAIVVSILDDQFGRRPVAFVSGRLPLIDELCEALPKFMLPDHIFEMPPSSSLKPDRQALEQLAARLAKPR